MNDLQYLALNRPAALNVVAKLVRGLATRHKRQHAIRLGRATYLQPF
jgi:hypothetical protein